MDYKAVALLQGFHGSSFEKLQQHVLGPGQAESFGLQLATVGCCNVIRVVTVGDLSSENSPSSFGSFSKESLLCPYKVPLYSPCVPQSICVTKANISAVLKHLRP